MSSSLCLPPAPNWFSSCILDTSPEGLLAYGAKNHLVVVKPLAPPQGSDRDNWRNETEADRQFPQVHVTYQGHSDKAKLSCVCWCPSADGGPGGQNVMSAADDGTVRVWRWADGNDTDEQKLKLMGQHCLHGEEGRSMVKAASWSKADPSIIVTADDNGLVGVWDLTTNSIRSLNYGKNAIFSISCHPTNPQVAAFGCKLGLVFIVSLSGTGRVIHRMRGHDEDVFSVQWCPDEEVQVAGDRLGQQERVLASASRDRTVRLWASVAGRVMSTVKLPGGYARGKGGGQQTWISCNWAGGSTLLTSGTSGELLKWDLSKPSAKGGFEWEVLHKEHNRTLFNIAVHGDVVYTVGQDRAVVCHTVSQGKLLYNLPTFAGFVYCLAVNPIDPSIVAIGGGDGQIRIWRTGSPALFDISYLWQKLNQSKIYSLAWHPHKEGLLAYGTDEGRVGWFEAFSNGKPPAVSSYQHRSGVYNVSWGPVVSGGADLGLYSCGDGVVILHSPKQGGKPVDVQELITEKNASDGNVAGKKTQVVWRQMAGKSLLCLGCDDGTIEIYLIPDLKLIATLRTHTKLIQALAWHPTHLAAGQPSKHPGWLATASNLNDIHVFDLSSLLVEADVEPVVLVSPDFELEGHLQRVIELNWSPHKDGRLVSVSYDFSGQVWDVEAKLPLHNFQGHSGRLMCCMWHPTLEGLVLTGAEDFTLHGWWPEEQAGDRPVDRRRKKKEKREVAWAEREVKEGSEGKESKELSFDELLKKHKKDQSNLVVDIGEKGDGKREGSVSKEEGMGRRNERGEGGMARTIETFDQVQKEKRKRNNQTKSLFPLSSKAEGNKSLATDTVEDCILLAKLNKNIENQDKVSSNSVDIIKDLSDNLAELKVEETEGIGKGSKIHLGYFHDRSALLGLLGEELEELDTEGRGSLGLWQGDLGAVLKQAAAVGQLSERLVGMAAGVSQAAWREAALAFAHQLNKEGQFTKASDYYLAVHDVYSAVDVLRKNGYFRAAISVARCRLAPDDPVIGQVLECWAKQSRNDGNYKLAAKCCVAAGKFGEGAEILGKVGQTRTSRGAAWLSGAAGDLARQNVYTTQCLTGCLLEEDWTTGKALVADTPSMAWAGLLLLVHQAVTKAVAGKGGEASEPLLITMAKTAEKSNINLDDSSAVEAIAKFLQSTASRLHTVTVSCRLSLSLLSLTNTKDCLSHLAAALAGCHAHPNILASLVGACLPAGTTPPEVGKATVGVPLDWQCQWQALRSIQVSEAMLVLGGGGKAPELSRESAEEVADVFMLEDVIFLQKLQAEVEEAEIEIAKITDNKEQVNGVVALVNGTGDENVLDSEPSKNKDVDKPPTAASPSFRERFIEGREDSTEALKEFQKLRWLLSRTNVPDAPFPNLSDCCKRLVSILQEVGLGEDPPMEGEELPEVEGMEILGSMPGRKEEELGLRRRLARWGFHHGQRTYQQFFLQHS